MQLQCNSVSGALLQYSLQNFAPAATVHSQLGWAHFSWAGGSLVSGMESSLSRQWPLTLSCETALPTPIGQGSFAIRPRSGRAPCLA